MSTATAEKKCAPTSSVWSHWATLRDLCLEELSDYAEKLGLTAELVEPGDGIFRIEIAKLHFPDSVGQGRVVLRGYEYMEQPFLELRLEHNRAFKGANQQPRGNLYLNDFYFCRPMDRPLPRKDISAAIADLECARLALESYRERLARHGQLPSFLEIEATINPEA